VTLADLVRDLEQRRTDAERVQATAPLSAVYGEILALLQQVDGAQRLTGFVNTREAGRMLGVKPKTVTHWCEKGRFPGVRKSGLNGGGIWLIPASEVYACLPGRLDKGAA
jgi:hypothetical protein